MLSWRGCTSTSLATLGQRMWAANGHGSVCRRTPTYETCKPGLWTRRFLAEAPYLLASLYCGNFGPDRLAFAWGSRGRRRYAGPCSPAHSGTLRFLTDRQEASSQSRELLREDTYAQPGWGATRREATARIRNRCLGRRRLSMVRISRPDCIRRSWPSGGACRSFQIRRPCECRDQRPACAGLPRRGLLPRLLERLVRAPRMSKVREHQLLRTLRARVGDRRVGHAQSRLEQLPYLELRPGSVDLGSPPGCG